MTHAFDESREAAAARAVETADQPAPAWHPVVLPGGAQQATPARRRLAGLDGLRAVAVLAVVTFHLDFSLASGGFLGVDVFFVISGFLITNLIAREILETGRLQLGRFYLRRARRLLPAMAAMLVVVTVAGATIWRDQLSTLKSGALASLGYVTNWWLIADDQNYFDSTGRPSMLQHLWSLAIEEQFYLVWSIAVVAMVGMAAARIDPVARVRLVAVTALVLAVASTVTMTVLAVRDNLPYFGSTSRVYFGSDTHAMGLFLGSACGAWLAVHTRAAPVRPARLPAKFVWLTDVLGAVALVVLVVQFFVLTEFSTDLYRGGFLAFDALALAVIVCAVRRRSLLGRILDMRPVRWVGQRSYSIYIWHWPVVVVTRPDLDVRGPLVLINLCRLALILGLGALSYHFIEVPLRTGQFARWRAARRDRARLGWDTAMVGTTLVAALCLGGAASAVGSTTLPRVPFAAQSTPFVAPQPQPRGRPEPHPSASGTSTGRSVPSASPRPATARVPISAFGDSVLLGAQSALRAIARRLDVDAVEGRQPYEVLDDVLARARARTLEPYVVVHTGNNGIISPDQLRATLRALHDCTRVVLVNDRVPREWQDPNNATLASVAKGFVNVRLVDWYALSSGKHGWLYSDGLHLTPAGTTAYARLIDRALTH
jgi:peptidoglycan/LPS O-acetylase OafA/YrhL